MLYYITKTLDLIECDLLEIFFGNGNLYSSYQNDLLTSFRYQFFFKTCSGALFHKKKTNNNGHFLLKNEKTFISMDDGYGLSPKNYNPTFSISKLWTNMNIV